jgi:hypothetical protein
MILRADVRSAIRARGILFCGGAVFFAKRDPPRFWFFFEQGSVKSGVNPETIINNYHGMILA